MLDSFAGNKILKTLTSPRDSNAAIRLIRRSRVPVSFVLAHVVLR